MKNAGRKMNITKSRELELAKIRLTNALADKNELKNAITRREYISRTEINREYAKVAGNIKSKLLALPAKLAPVLNGLSPSEIASVLEENIYEVLNELAEKSLV